MTLRHPTLPDWRSIQGNFEGLDIDYKRLIARLEVFEQKIKFGTGSPEGVLEAAPGVLFVNEDEPAELWQKETGTGDTGWVQL